MKTLPPSNFTCYFLYCTLAPRKIKMFKDPNFCKIFEISFISTAPQQQWIHQGHWNRKLLLTLSFLANSKQWFLRVSTLESDWKKNFFFSHGAFSFAPACWSIASPSLYLYCVLKFEKKDIKCLKAVHSISEFRAEQENFERIGLLWCSWPSVVSRNFGAFWTSFKLSSENLAGCTKIPPILEKTEP